MPRKKLIRTDEYVYHITARSNCKEWFYIPQNECWSLFCEELSLVNKVFDLEIHAYVLMSNHYHLMARTPLANIDKAMHQLNKNIARRINMSTGRINHVFGRPYNWSLITRERYYFYATRYLYQNPVRAGICERVEDYPYSSLHHNVKWFPLTPYNSFDLRQLNSLFKEEDAYRIKKGFKKTIFKPSYNQSSRMRDL